MKKFLNRSEDILNEAMRGYEMSHQKLLFLPEESHSMMRRNPKKKGKVKLVMGNGGGHEPGMIMMSVPKNEVNIGAGIHGEGGAGNDSFGPCAEIMKKAVDMLLEDKPYVAGDEVILLVNGMGSTTLMEMGIAYQDICAYLEKCGIKVYDGTAGDYLTTQEMGGISISICKVDDELKKMWDAKCRVPAYVN